jgi:ATP-dependent helicase/nuclease subunit B
MDIVFGLWADGGAAPDHGGEGAGALGAPVVGPNGLLEILELPYGLSRPPSAWVVRIAAWQTALEAADNSQRFWSKSLEVDAWATARTLLSWRDQLIAAGWQADGAWSGKRLVDLAAAEHAARELPDGLADRIARLSDKIDGNISRTVRRIRLIDARAHHPIGWRRLFDALEARGCMIEEIGASPSAPADTALGRLQRWMAAGGELDGSPDGSVTLATSTSSALAGELVGQWFSIAAPKATTVLVAQDADTQLLDHGLLGAGQPRAGRSRRSPHRGSLQLLLLAFKIAWLPFDAHALMELLLFARSPIAQRAVWRLAAALEHAPGRGSEAWRRAWTEIEAEELAIAESELERTKAVARFERWRAWAEPVGADPILGVPGAEAAAICDRTISWAVARYALGGDPLYLATATIAGDVRRALIALERSHYPRNLIERVIDQALDEGQNNPGASAEAAAWRCVSHPGGVWAPTDSLVWWNFGRTQEGLTRAPWTAAERTELAQHHCIPDDPSLAANAVSAAWERAILNTRARVLFVASGLDARAEEALHPFAHRIAPALDALADKARLEDALTQSVTNLAGAALERIAVKPAELPASSAVWTTPAGFAERLAKSNESATSFENLLSCQLMWALRHVAQLRPGRARSIPDQNRLLGNLAHALVREIFRPGVPPAPDDAAEQTRALLDPFIDQLAAPLRQPGLATDLAFARRRLPEAVAELSRVLTENCLTIEATEQQVSATFEDALAVRGAIDLVARDAAGTAVIIDLKWTRSARSRLDELQSGRAVQLATYGAMLVGDGAYRAGYFLLNQRQFATLTSGGLIGRSVDGVRTLPETWLAILASWRQWRDTADAGSILALGVEGVNDHLPVNLPIQREVRCEWCDYATLCRVRGLQ